MNQKTRNKNIPPKKNKPKSLKKEQNKFTKNYRKGGREVSIKLRRPPPKREEGVDKNYVSSITRRERESDRDIKTPLLFQEGGGREGGKH